MENGLLKVNKCLIKGFLSIRSIYQKRKQHIDKCLCVVCFKQKKDRCLKLSYIMGLGKTTGGKHLSLTI